MTDGPERADAPSAARRDDVTAASAPPASRIPDFFIVGAPRSGTTALFEQLRQHPEVFVPRVKEPVFFGNEHPSRRSLEQYLALFADAGDAVRVGEASATYLYWRTAPSEIREFNPDARIIIMLRDPVAVMYALHSIAIWTGHEPIRDFSAALEAQERRRTGLEPNPHQLSYYRDIVDYERHVRTYFDTFGRERVHIVIFDDWVADMRRVFRETLEFLEVDPSFVPKFEVVNQNRQVRVHRLHDVIARPPAALQRVTHAVLSSRIRRPIQRKLLGLNSRPAPREPIDPALLATLRAEFAPMIERLARLIDRDLSAWTAES